MTRQKDPGPPQWLPGGVTGPFPRAAAPLRATLDGFVAEVRRLPLLNPLPGIFPRATFGGALGEGGRPHVADIMLGFWPPQSVARRGGRLVTTSAIVNLMVYVNQVREGALSQDTWFDAEGTLLPHPKVLSDVQGFPVYKGFGGYEVSGILVVLPPGRSLFAPVTQERFRRFEIATLEKRLKEVQPALARAEQAYAEFVSPAGRARRDAQRKKSLEEYAAKRPRTPEQMTYRAAELLRFDGEEEARLKTDASPDGNRVTGWLRADLAEARRAFDALTPEQRRQPAFHRPDSRKMGPHAVLVDTPDAVPVVTFARWWNPALPRTAAQIITVERYWMCADAVRRGMDRRPSHLPDHYNAAVVEALDWRAIARKLLR